MTFSFVDIDRRFTESVAALRAEMAGAPMPGRARTSCTEGSRRLTRVDFFVYSRDAPGTERLRDDDQLLKEHWSYIQL